MSSGIWTLLALAAMTALCTISTAVQAAGHSAHEQVNLLAKQYHVQDSTLRSILQSRNTTFQSGSAHPDAGYVNGNEHIAETMHWADFHMAYARYLVDVCKGKYSSDTECSDKVAHFMGVVGHSVVDNYYDFLFHDSKVKYYDAPVSDSSFRSPDAAIDNILYDTYGQYFVEVPEATHVADVSNVFWRMNLRDSGYSELTVFGAMAAQHLLSIGARGDYTQSKARSDYWWEGYRWLFRQWRPAIGGVDHLSELAAKVMDYYWLVLNGQSTATAKWQFFPATENDGLLQIEAGGHDRHDLHIIFDRPVLKSDVKANFKLRDSQNNIVAGSVEFQGENQTPYGYIARFVPADGLRANTRYTATLTDVHDAWGGTLPARSSETVTTGLPHNIALTASDGRTVRAINAGGDGIRADANGPNLHEVLNFVPLSDGRWAIRSLGGHSLYAVNGGSGDLRFPWFHVQGHERFQMLAMGGNKFALRCPDGSYVQNGNGVSCRGSSASATGATFTYERISPLVGGNGGGTFSLLAPPNGQYAEKLILRGDADMDGVGISVNGVDTWRGGGGGSETRLTVSSSAWVRKAEVCLGGYNDSYIVRYMYLETNLGANVWKGTRTGTCETIFAPDGMRIDGFIGASGSRLDRVGFVFRPNPGYDATYAKWAAGEPNNYQGLEKCAEFRNDGQWNDNSCALSRLHACRNQAGQWTLGSEPASWEKALCPVGYAFAAPVNDADNSALRAAVQWSGNPAVVWINRSVQSNTRWQGLP